MKYPTKLIIILSGLSYLLFLSFAVIAQYIIPLREGYLGIQIAPDAPYLMWIWANFDGRHYIEIAQKGYEHTNFAFFPLYSLLIYLGKSLIGIDYLYIGLILSGIFTYLGMLMVYKIVSLDYGRQIAKYALIAFSFLPFSFFYYSVYTDSLFLFLSTACLYSARRKLWFISGIFAGLSFFDRFTGIALLPALAVEWYLQERMNYESLKSSVHSFFRTALIAILLGILGFLSYLVYLEIVHGNFLLFQKARSAWGEDKFVFPLQTIYRYIKIFIDFNPFILEYWIAALEFLTLGLYLSIAGYVTKKIRLSYGIFMVFLLIIIPFMGTFAGNPRYILHLFPFYIVFGLWLSKYKRFRILFAAVSIILGFVMVTFFTRGYFVS